MKKIICLTLLLLFLSGCSVVTKIESEKINNIDVTTPTEIDCEHNVICYRGGMHVASFSCVYIPDIKECD